MKLYRPSNGTEGERFMSKYCYNCEHDNDQDGCPILMRTMIYDVHDKEYPVEWVTSDTDGAVCVAYEAAEKVK
jgi:hypothetical protein